MAFTTWQTLGMEFQTRRGLGMSESLVGTALHTWRKLGSEFHSCTANMMGATTGHRIVITPFTKIATTNLRTDPIVSPSCWRFLRDTMIPGVIVRKNNTHTHKQIPGRLNFLSLKSTIYGKIRNRNDQRWAKQWSLCRNGAGGTYLVGQLLQQMETHRVSTRVQFAGPLVLIGWTTSLHLSSIRLCSLVIQWSSKVCLGVQLADLVHFTLGGLSPRSLGSKKI
jgi:hypothetical protein